MKNVAWYNGVRLATILLVAGCAAISPAARAEDAPAHSTAERSGEVATSSGQTLYFHADLGSVRIQTLTAGAPPVVRYNVHIETDARDPVAQTLLERYTLNAQNVPNGVSLTGAVPAMRRLAERNAQFWVQFVVTVPVNFSVEVSTGMGDIETSDIRGHALLVTQAGNIRTGRIDYLAPQSQLIVRPAAKLETQGGHIVMKDVTGGDVDVYTAGGHIQAGNIVGSAKLRTGGGHIRAEQIKGTAQLETDGGNITVGEAGSLVGVRTGGGQIDFGEVHGSVHAQTAGGGIRVMYVSGPMEVETSGGSICLTRVVNTIRAETGGGTITAWITPDSREPNRAVRLPGPSQLGSGTGDIVVFLPRNIAATIDATVEIGGPGRIEADPALLLNVQSHPEGPVHALGNLNGGGSLLKLRTTSGKIRLQYVDAEIALRQSLLDEQKQRLRQKLSEGGLDHVIFRTSPPVAISVAPPAPIESKADWFDGFRMRLEITFLGGIHEDTEEFKKHLVNSPTPDYPQLARRAGLQGVVRLQVRLKKDGTLTVEKVLEGEPALVDAATSAIRQWRANPEEFAGQKVEVISTVIFNFQLH